MIPMKNFAQNSQIYRLTKNGKIILFSDFGCTRRLISTGSFKLVRVSYVMIRANIERH